MPAGEPFWMVWRSGREPVFAPKFRHASFEAADTEAQRLAREHPGQEFVVLESVRSHQLHMMVTTDLRVDRGMPF